MTPHAWIIGCALACSYALAACDDRDPERGSNGSRAGAAGTGSAGLDGGPTRDGAVSAGRSGSDEDAGREPADAATADAATVDAGRTGRPGTGPISVGPASCRNRVRDGNETDIDCGGPDCGSCLSGRRCEEDSDCASGECDGGACTCLPLTACPQGACGVVRHCGGELDCGACEQGVCYGNQCCMPRECAEGECGVFLDGCGGTMRCGDESCCTPRSCEHPSLENRCGAFDDRCGGSVTCGCADDAARCYLGECCAPRTCEATGACGIPMADGCGGTMRCTCGADETCYQNRCCTPGDCSAWQGPGCGQVDDGCGGTVTCGCDAGERCNAGTCCTPTPCGAGLAGDACGSNVADDCGGTQPCTCAGGLPCMGGTCCEAQSCAQQGLDHRCGPATDGCGTASLWCGCGTSAGIRVAQRNACAQGCGATLAAVRTCTTSAALEVLDQTSGWDFGSSLSSNLCTTSYGFSPNWTQCHNGFQLDAQGFVYLTAGTHCFSVTGSGLGACGALYLVQDAQNFTGWDALPGSTPATVTTGAAAACFTLPAAGYYPIRWHYSQSGAFSSFRVNYCPGSAANCAPLPSSMLRPSLP
jgi:hypothetical protein